MSKNRREWFDAFISVALLFAMLAVLNLTACLHRKMNPWLITGVCAGIAIVSVFIAMIIRGRRRL